MYLIRQTRTRIGIGQERWGICVFVCEEVSEEAQEEGEHLLVSLKIVLGDVCFAFLGNVGVGFGR